MIGLAAIALVFVSVSALLLALISWFTSDWAWLAIQLICVVISLIGYWGLFKSFIRRCGIVTN